MPDYGALIDQADAASDAGAGTLGAPGATAQPGAAAGSGTSPAAAATPDANPWSAVIDQADNDAVSRGQLALYGARQSQPDQAARDAQTGAQLGVPQTVIGSDRAGFEQRAQLQQNSAILQSNPALADWVAQNPLAPHVASDDLSNLSWLARTAREWTSGYGGAAQSAELNRLYYAGQNADPAKVASLEASMKAATSDPAASGFVHAIAGMVGGLADLAEHAAPAAAAGGLVGAGIGAAAAGLPTSATAAPIGALAGYGVGTAAGAGASMFSDMFKQGYGAIGHTLDQVRDASGNKINPVVGVGASLLGGLASAALNTFGMGLGAAPATQAATGLLSVGLRQALTRPTVVSALGTFAGGIAKSGLAGAGLGTAMEVGNVIAEETAKQLSTGDFDTVFNDPATRQEAVGRIAESAANMALMLGVMHGTGGLPTLLSDGLRARRAADDMATFSSLEQGAADSKVRGRSPSLFQDWMSRQTDGTPAESLFIPAAKVAELYQSLDVQPGRHDGIFGGFVPDIADQLSEGSTTGGDVVVPTSGYLTHLAGTDISRRLQPDIRVRQDGMSLNDAAQFQEEYGRAIQARNAELQQQADDAAAQRAPADQVADEVRTQASAAGFGSDAAQQYAALYGARYATRGERLGVDPLDLFRREGVQIEQAAPPGLTATAPDNLDVMLNHIRRGDADPTAASLYGPTLAEFLAKRGGVEDPDGDLAAMGAGDFHKGKPGARRLVRPPRDELGAALPGMSSVTGDNEHTPDAAARAAWEEGYFPSADRPDVSTFYDALRDDLAGNHRYTEQGAARGDDFRAAADDLERHLHGLGIDPAKATNAEIRRVLDQHDTDGGGRSYAQGASGDPVAKLRGDEIAPADADLPTLRAAARTYYEKELRGQSVHSAALDRDVEFRSGRKAFSASANPDKLRLFAGLRDIIANGRLENSAAPRDAAAEPTTKAYHYLTAPVEIGGKPVRVGVMVREDANGHLYYNHTPIEGDAGGPDLRPAGTRRNDRPGNEGGGATHDQSVVPAGDGVNLDLRNAPAPEVITRKEFDASGSQDWQAFSASVVQRVQQALDDGRRVTLRSEDGKERPITSTARGAMVDDKGQSWGTLGALSHVGASVEIEAPPEPAAEAAGGGLGVSAPAGPENAAPGAEPTRRGSIQLAEGRALISLFAKRDLSTLLHESGHLWLDELVRDAAGDDAPEQLRGDLATIMQWMGVEKPEDIGVDQHEQFARGFERYLMEGKAPSAALRGAFGRFKAWLTRIYKAVSSLNAQIDPAVRGVFDRLLASDAEIDHARQGQGLGQLFKTAADAGMTEPEFAAYQASVDRVRSDAVDGLSHKVLGDIRRQRTAEWREAEAPIREDVTREVDARPDMKALRLLRTGKPDGVEGEGQRIRLDRNAIVDAYGGSDSVLSMLPKTVPPLYSDKGGMHPDFVAEMAGQRSGTDMLQALMAHEAQRQELRGRGDPRSVRQYRIDDETYARMVERHGDALQDGSIESDALDELHNERQLQVLGTELRALGRRAGMEATPTQVAKAWAERSISEKTIKLGTQPGTYLRAEATAGRAALRAVLAGDHAEAFRQKQAQLLNHALYISAKVARDDVQAGMARFQRFGAKAMFPTIEPGYVDRIHDLMRRFHLPIKRDGAELDRALGSTTLERWATDRIGEGHEIYVAPDLYDGTFAKPIDMLSVAQFRELADTVKSIAHVGRGEQSVIVDGAKAERDAVKASMIEQLGKLPQRKPQDFVSQGGRTGIMGALDNGVSGVAGFHAMLLKPEAIIDRLDADDPNGIFNRAIFRPLKAAQGVANDLKTEVAGRLRAIRDKTGKDYGRDWNQTLLSPSELIDKRTGEPIALKRRGLIGMALNVGNESNLQRLVDGYGWTREGVKAVLDRHMKPADWQYVQGVWDTYESLFPRIEAMQRRMTGVGLEKVEPREVETAGGTLKGGYYPVVYDPNLSVLGDRIKAAGEARFEADYARATTPKGHTIARQDKVSEPLSLDPDLTHWKLGQATHDLAYREAIVNADKLLRDKGVMNAIDGAIGRDQRKQLDTWLQSIANERNIDTRGLAAMDAFIHKAKTNATIVGIGFRASTMVKHGATALANSLGELGPVWLAKGSAEFFGSGDRMARNYAMISGKSSEMRYRMDSIDRDVREALRDLQGKNSLVSDAVRFSHYGVASLDMLSALPTWLGAYRKAEAQAMEESDAVAFADKTVRNAHGANGTTDLAAIQRGGETQKLFTMIYGFFNHIYNRQVVGVRALGSGSSNVMQGNFAGARRDFAKALSTFTFYLVMPALIEGMVSQGGPSDDDNPLGWAAKQVAGEIPAGVPILRDVAKAAIEGRDYEMSPVAKVASTILGTEKDVASMVGLREKDASARWLQHAIETSGYILGLPTGQLGQSAQFLADVSGGKEDPQGIADWLRGVMYGPPPKHAAAH